MPHFIFQEYIPTAWPLSKDEYETHVSNTIYEVFAEEGPDTKSNDSVIRVCNCYYISK